MAVLAWIIFALLAALGAWAAWKARAAAALGRRSEAEAPPIGRFLDMPGGGRLHYLEMGADAASEDPPIVLVHGLGGSLRHFHGPVMAALSAERRVIAVDRPGSGYSAGDGDGIAAQAAFLVEGMAALGVARAVWVGHSWGGAAALRIALDHPQAVAALALIAPGAVPFTPKPPFPSETVGNALMRKALAWTVLLDQLQAARGVLTAMVFLPEEAPLDYETAGGGVLALRPWAAEATLRDQAALQPGLAEQAPRYGDLKAPISVLFGEQDAILDGAAQIAALSAAAPQTRARVLPGRGHMLSFTAPEEVVATIREAAAAA